MDTPESDRIGVLLRGVLRLGRRLRAERPPGGASLSAVGVMATLHRAGPMPATRLAAAEHLQPQSLTRILAGLERAGCIARTPGSTDRRERLIALTQAGRDVLAADMQGRRRWLEQAMTEALSPAERQALLRAGATLARLARFGDATDDA